MSARIDGLGVSELLASGLFAHPSATTNVVERFGVPGSTDPSRVFIGRLLGGFEHEVIASRGLDIGYAAWRGIPLSWTSPVRDARPLDRPAGSAWLSRFTGGLLTTCGPFHIGEDDGVHGLHGDFSHRPATRVSAQTGDGRIDVSGVIEAHDLFGPSVSIERTISSEAGPDCARLTVTDRVSNTGSVPAPVAMLYHLNLGPPVAVPGTRVLVDSSGWRFHENVPEVPTPSVLPSPCHRVVEAVAEYTGVRADDDGWAHAVVGRPGSGIEVDVAWRRETLPHLYQWIYPTEGRWAVAIEPASAPLFAAASGDTRAGAPLLPANGTRLHEIMVTVSEAA